LRTCSAHYLSKKQREGLLYIFAGLGAGAKGGPTFGGDLIVKGAVEFPLVDAVVLVDDEYEWKRADLLAGLLFQLQRLVEGSAAGAVGNQEEAGGAVEGRPTHFLEIVFAVDVPQDQGHFRVAGLHNFFHDLDADGGLVFVGIDTFDVAADETGFADSEGTEHADFFLDHVGPSEQIVNNGTERNTAIVRTIFFGILRPQRIRRCDTLNTQ